MSGTQKNNTTVIKCRNCGCSCTSNFCPDCGQPTKVKRLENRTFFIDLLSGLSRINSGFLYTAWRLLTRPWKVIRDYINCRRINYIAPVSMLIVVCFLNAFVAGLMASGSQPMASEMDTASIPLSYRVALSVTHFLMNNMLARNLTIYLPALLSILIVYRRAGAKKYNLAEYIAAMIYMASSFLLFDVIISPLAIISESWYSGLEIVYSLLICSLSMYHAFPLGSIKKRIGYFILYLLVSVVLYLLILLAIAMILGLDKTSVMMDNL